MRIYAETGTLFFEGQNGLKMMVSGLNHLLGRFQRSEFVQSGRNASPDVVGKSTRGHPENTDWGSSGPLEASWRPLEAKPNRQ